MIYVDNHTFT